MELCTGGQKSVPYLGDCAPRHLTVEDRLLQRKQSLSVELKEVTEALDALQAHPELLKVLSLISKVHY